MVRPFERKSSRYVLETPIFRVRQDTARHPETGHEGDFVVLESPDWVNVVALTQEGEVVLVRQWRHGTRSLELEIPAGLVDGDESPLEAAVRELREETGYVPAHVEVIGSVAPNAAFQDNTCTTVLATGCQLLASTDFDPAEDLEVETVSVEELWRLVDTGVLRNGMVLCGLLWWTRHSSR